MWIVCIVADHTDSMDASFRIALFGSQVDAIARFKEEARRIDPKVSESTLSIAASHRAWIGGNHLAMIGYRVTTEESPACLLCQQPIPGPIAT